MIVQYEYKCRQCGEKFVGKARECALPTSALEHATYCLATAIERDTGFVMEKMVHICGTDKVQAGIADLQGALLL